MIKFRNRELRYLRISKPEESMSYLYNFCSIRTIRNIRIKAIIERDGLNHPMDFVLDSEEYKNFYKLSGVFKTTLESGEPYLFRFLPSDKLIVLKDNYDERYEEEYNRVSEKRQNYKERYQKKLDEWQKQYDLVKSKPRIYWESRKKEV